MSKDCSIRYEFVASTRECKSNSNYVKWSIENVNHDFNNICQLSTDHVFFQILKNKELIQFSSRNSISQKKNFTISADLIGLTATKL
ncbi:hypothetical protein X798_01859 [Onchocerca flexuosa]|uniref:Uncharacterized protein n=1 Tax=Onchocerca flexuosa TaxID=387005 RepID=A0A238C0Q3_9BILA|nr:hypothetical protein X798_01859 [Onchocerca flexuosa]